MDNIEAPKGSQLALKRELVEMLEQYGHREAGLRISLFSGSVSYMEIVCTQCGNTLSIHYVTHEYYTNTFLHQDKVIGCAGSGL